MPRSSVSVPDLFHVLHVFICPVFLISGFFYFLFSQFTLTKFVTAGAILGAWAIIFLFVVCIDKVLNSMYEDSLVKYKRSVLIGCTGAFLASWFPRVMSYTPEILFPYDNETFWYAIFVSLPTITIFWAAFIANYKDRCEVVYRTGDKAPWIILLVNCFILLITARLGMLFGRYEDQRGVIWTQLCFSPISTACMIEFFQVLRGNIFLWSAPVPQVLQEHGKPKNHPVSTTFEGLDCKICLDEYSDVKVPRMLKECGHTVCEGCADNLLKQNNGQHLFCPFCQKVTIVNGSASQLPKNFAICDMVERKKKGTNWV